MIALHLAVFWMVRDQVAEGSPDFSIFYTAGLMLRRGQGSLLYSDSLQRETQREFIPKSYERPNPLPYNHPPFEALLYLGLAGFSFLRAYEMWFVVNLLFLAAFVYLARGWLPRLRSTFPELLFLAPLAFFPVAYALMQGQDSILLLLLYALAYSALRRAKDVQGGAYLGLGLFKFHLVLPFVFILLLVRRWRAVFGVMLTAALELVVSLALVGWKELLYYPRYALQVNRLRPSGVIVPENMPNLRGLLTGWPGLSAMQPWPNVVLLAASLGLVVWAASCWRAADPTHEDPTDKDLVHVDDWNAGFSIALLATFLVGYHGYNQDMSILLLPMLITLDRLLQFAPGQSRRIGILMALMFFSPLMLILTMHYTHQNLFALVLIALAFGLSAWSARPLAGESANAA